MTKVNGELKRVVDRLKTAQTRLQGMLKDKTWVEEARKYAERQGKEVRKLITADVGRVKTFLERERKELERIQKNIPGEVKKLRKFVDAQRKEFEKLLTNVRKVNKKAAAGKKGGKKSGGARKKSSTSASTSSSAQA